MRRRVRLSAAEARRVALAAQNLHLERPASAPDARHFRNAMQALQVLQLDFVNVLVPAHNLVLWSRLGAYDRQRFERFVYHGGDYTEQWAHEASIVPSDAWPLLAHRRAAYEPSKYNPLRKLRDRNGYLDDVLEQVRGNGALTSADLPPVPGPTRRPGDWHRSIPRWALEFHFARGDLAVARRLPNFQRVYDLPERVLPADQLTVSHGKEAAEREMLRRASVALGVATKRDLADYFRLSPRDTAPRIEELVEEGALSRVDVENWQEPGYLSCAARLPRAIDLRSARLVPSEGRAAVRFPLPHRDLRAGRPAQVGLLRAAVPARRPHRCASRPQGGPASRAAARAGGTPGTRCESR